MTTRDDIKLGKRFSFSCRSWNSPRRIDSYEVEVVFVTDRGFLVRFKNGSESYKAFLDTVYYNWVEIKPKTKKKVFFYSYKQVPNRIYTHTDCSQFYAIPVSIECSHKSMRVSPAILWVSEIHEIVFDTPEVK